MRSNSLKGALVGFAGVHGGGWTMCKLVVVLEKKELKTSAGEDLQVFSFPRLFGPGCESDGKCEKLNKEERKCDAKGLSGLSRFRLRQSWRVGQSGRNWLFWAIGGCAVEGMTLHYGVQRCQGGLQGDCHCKAPAKEPRSLSLHWPINLENFTKISNDEKQHLSTSE